MPVTTYYNPETGDFVSYTESGDVSQIGQPRPQAPSSQTPPEVGNAPTSSPLPAVPDVLGLGAVFDWGRQNGRRLAVHAGAVFLGLLLIFAGVAAIAAPRIAPIAVKAVKAAA